MRQSVAPMDLENLESRIVEATRVIRELKNERDALRKSSGDLESRLRKIESTAASAMEWRQRATQAEGRVARYAQERGSLLRRVEQMLEKVRAVEEEALGTAT